MGRDSNPQPPAWAGALPTELHHPGFRKYVPGRAGELTSSRGKTRRRCGEPNCCARRGTIPSSGPEPGAPLLGSTRDAGEGRRLSRWDAGLWRVRRIVFYRKDPASAWRCSVSSLSAWRWTSPSASAECTATCK